MIDISPDFRLDDQAAWPPVLTPFELACILRLNVVKTSVSSMTTSARRIARLNKIPIIPNIKENLYTKEGVVAFLKEQHHRGAEL